MNHTVGRIEFKQGEMAKTPLENLARASLKQDKEMAELKSKIVEIVDGLPVISDLELAQVMPLSYDTVYDWALDADSVLGQILALCKEKQGT